MLTDMLRCTDVLGQHCGGEKMEVNLHIGLHKTGTTTLQAVLDANRDQLGATTRLYNHNSRELLPLQRACLAFSRKPDEQAGKHVQKTLETLLQNAQDTNTQKVIISSEMLTGPVPAFKRKGGIEGCAVRLAYWLREGTKGHDAKFCIYIRDQEKWLTSLHAHLLRSRGIRMTRADFLKKADSCNFRIEEFATKIADAAGSASIFRMEDDLSARLGPGHSFLQFSGYDETVLAQFKPVAAKNIGLHRAAVERMEAPAYLALPSFIRKYLVRHLNRTAPNNGQIMNKLSKLLKNIARATHAAIRLPRTMRKLREVYGPVRLRAASRVAVFPELGLAYNRIKKNANTSTVILLRHLESGNIEDRNAAKQNVRRYVDLDNAQLDAIDALHLFVIIRNPYSRVLSAFMDKFRSERYQRRFGRFPISPDGFGDFLKWLEAGGLSRDAHWDLQTKLMMLPLSSYDSVIQFDNFREGLITLLTARGITVPDGALADLYPSDKMKKTGSSSKLREYYTPERIKIVQRLYAKDFSELGYSTDLAELN